MEEAQMGAIGGSGWSEYAATGRDLRQPSGGRGSDRQRQTETDRDSRDEGGSDEINGGDGNG